MKLFSRLLLLIAPSVAIGLAVGVAILALKHFNPGKDPARVTQANVLYVSALPAGYAGTGCSTATETKDSAGQPVTVVMTYACVMPTASPSSCPSGTVEKRFGSSIPVCDVPQK